jgi:hypothetical protein
MELTSLKKDLCGKTQFFGDQYLDGQCVYKKCNATCTEGIREFEFGGNVYTRETYCCNDADYCNSAPGGMGGKRTIVVVCSTVIALFVSLYIL